MPDKPDHRTHRPDTTDKPAGGGRQTIPVPTPEPGRTSQPPPDETTEENRRKRQQRPGPIDTPTPDAAKR